MGKSHDSRVKLQVQKEDLIEDALKIIENYPFKIAVVVDAHNKIIGTVTDGDVRRGLLNGYGLKDRIAGIMNKQPKFAIVGEDLTPYLNAIKNNLYRQLIIVTKDLELYDIISVNDLLKEKKGGVAVIMAGGKGQRLRPITDTIPKPMVEVGGKPMLEHLINRLHSQHFTKLFLSVNYKKEIIKEYFKDGSNFGVEIKYLEEEEAIPLGTAGSLSMLPASLNETFLVLNSDLVTDLDFSSLMIAHESSNHVITVGVRKYIHQVPFGTIEIDDKQCIKKIIEKPTYSTLVSTGIYALSPEVLGYLKYREYLDMPDLINNLRAKNRRMGVFSIYESWHDVGKVEDLEFVRSNLDVR